MCDGSTKWQEIEHLRQVFRANGYPEAMIKGNLRGQPTLSHSSQTSQTPPKALAPPLRLWTQREDRKGLSTIGSEAVCRSRSTVRSALVQVKQPSEDRKKKGVYEVSCQDCECMYIREISRAIEKCLSEHKNAVKKHNSNNGIAAHAWTNQHQVDWKAAKTREMEENYRKRRVLEALRIHQQQHTPTRTWSGNQSFLATTA